MKNPYNQKDIPQNVEQAIHILRRECFKHDCFDCVDCPCLSKSPIHDLECPVLELYYMLIKAGGNIK